MKPDFMGIYTHPHARGIGIELKREGWLRFAVLLWKWEFAAHWHRKPKKKNEKESR